MRLDVRCCLRFVVWLGTALQKHGSYVCSVALVVVMKKCWTNNPPVSLPTLLVLISIVFVPYLVNVAIGAETTFDGQTCCVILQDVMAFEDRVPCAPSSRPTSDIQTCPGKLPAEIILAARDAVCLPHTPGRES